MGLLALGAMCSVGGAIVTRNRNTKYHALFAVATFSLIPVAISLFSVSLINYEYSLAINLIMLSFVGWAGMAYLYFHKKLKALCQYWGLGFLTLWVSYFYLVL